MADRDKKEQQNSSDRFAELSKKVDDLVKMVESLRINKFTPNREIICWTCKQKGHIQAHCPYRENTNSALTNTPGRVKGTNTSGLTSLEN